MRCLSCNREIKQRHEVFGPIGEPLCWPCYSMELAELEDEEREERERVEEIKQRYSGFCPVCQVKLEVGVADWSVGRTCPKCGYHDYRQLYGELE